MATPTALRRPRAALLQTALAVLLLPALSPEAAAQGTAAAQASLKTSFPNAIHIGRADLDRLVIGVTGDEPEGLAALLSLYAGITFRNTGDPGAEDWLIIRNFGRDNSRLTLVLVDGRPLNLSNNHTVELDDLPVGLIESVTIHPGPIPARYGGYHSVVEIRTLPPGDRAEAAFGTGSLGTTRASALAGGAGRLNWRVSVDYEASDGRTGEALAGPLEGFAYGDRSVRTLLPSARLGYVVAPGLEATAQADLVAFRKAFASEPLFGQDPTRERGTQALSLRLAPPAGTATAADYEAVLFQTWEQETLNPIFPEDPSYNVHWGNQRRSITGARVWGRVPLAGALGLGAGAEAAWTRGRTDDDYVYFQYADRQAFYGAFVEADARPWDGTSLYAGLRLDGQEAVNRLALSPIVAVQQRLVGQVEAYATWGMSARHIPLNEVNTFRRPARVLGPPFLQAPGVVSLPARDLAMERMRAFEAGVRGALPGLPVSGRLAYFALSNQGPYGAPAFEVRPVEPGAPVPPGFEAALVAADRNLPGRDVSQGIEADLWARVHPRAEVSASLTRFLVSGTRADDGVELYAGPVGGPAAQAALNASVGQFVIPYAGRAVIPGAYTWLASGGVTFTPTARLALRGQARYRGATTDPIMKFGMDPGVAEIPASVVADLAARYTVPFGGARVSASLSVSNLFNTSYQTFVHYPMGGRFLLAGVSVERR